MTTTLRNNSLRVPREQTAHADVGKAQPKLYNPLQSETTTSMRRTSEPEAIDVVLGTCRLRVNRRVVLAHLRRKQLRVVDTLSTRADFLTAHEHVVRVGEERVGRRGHGVGWANRERELVKGIEVGVVLLEDQLAEKLLLWRSVLLLDILVLMHDSPTYERSS
jgi:hypothetical protein